MRIRFPLWLAAAGWLLLNACVPTLHPLYMDEDVVFEPFLVGTWQSDGDGEQWEFESTDDESYRLVYTDDQGQPGAFIAHLVKLGDDLFLDLYPEDREVGANEFYNLHILGLHSFMHVRAVEPELRMAPLDVGWLDEYIETHPDALATDTVGGLRIITASTSALQGFLADRAGDEEMWDEYSALKRVP